MDDGVPIRFNGVERDRSVVVIGRSGAVYSAVTRTPRQYASVIFTPQDRGWPLSGPQFKMFETSASAHQSLRKLVLQVLSVPCQSVDPPEVNGIQAAMRESLLAAVDAAFADIISHELGLARELRPSMESLHGCAGGAGRRCRAPVYSAELAQHIGVSVRTMRDAVKRYRGMSLHRYLRLRRLWLVRKRLLSGAHSVKACAPAFGFWHLSDFSRSYRFQFGETPSETLARSRHA